MPRAYYMKDWQYVLDRCAKYLNRTSSDFRHTYSTNGSTMPADNIAEAWRFPIIDTYAGGAETVTDESAYGQFNEVTFIYAAFNENSPASVSIIGTFNNLYEPIPLQRVPFNGEPTRYWTVTFAVPRAQTHLYRFLADGVPQNDPLNPQLKTLENGAAWSRFFTDGCTEPLVLERWELQLLERLVATIAPFHSEDAENFLQRYYNGLDRDARANRYGNAFRLDSAVGEANYIDHQLAREERHRLIDYKICLDLIDRVLRQRNPYLEPAVMTSETYVDLYNQMASDNVPGWNRSRYGSPRFFLNLLRRHTICGAFSHPKYGGNAGGAGWAFLAERYATPPPAPGKPAGTLFDWRRALEQPLGTNTDYHG